MVAYLKQLRLLKHSGYILGISNANARERIYFSVEMYLMARNSFVIIFNAFITLPYPPDPITPKILYSFKF
jgi:hypothetical protein